MPKKKPAPKTKPSSSPAFKAGERVRVRQGFYGNATGTISDVGRDGVMVALDNTPGSLLAFERGNVERIA